jgi:hypothetical protein
MATEEYWKKHRGFLLDSESSPLKRLLPMSPVALIAYGGSSALEAALSFLILGLPDQAQACLEFVERLQRALSDQNLLKHLPQHEQLRRAAYLRDYLHIGCWLRDGEIQSALAKDAYTHLFALNKSWGGRITQPNLHHLMLLSIEGGDLPAAGRLYIEHERHPLVLPPANLRFSSNARSLLYVCLAPPEKVSSALRNDAVEAFRRRASQWDRSVSPLPYVLPVTLARTLRACRMLLGQSYDLATVAAQVA